MPNDRPMPWPVVQRLPRYLTHVLVLRDEGVVWTSSHQLAGALGLTSSTVRQDLSHLALTGVSKRGYDAATLERVLREELGSDRVRRIVIVGAGRIGCSLLLSRRLKQHGFKPSGIFDADTEIVGTRIGRYVVRPMKELERVVRSRGVEVGVVAAPAEAAQEVANRLVEAGVQGILNLAYVHLNVPKSVSVVDVRILARLQELGYAIRVKKEAKGRPDKPPPEEDGRRPR